MNMLFICNIYIDISQSKACLFLFEINCWDDEDVTEYICDIYILYILSTYCIMKLPCISIYLNYKKMVSRYYS